jgi:hypothetical protein
MAVNQVVLVFSLRTRPGLKTYYRRLRETGSGKRGEFPKTEPELDDDISQAARFSPEQAVALRQYWRDQRYSVVVEDIQGNGPLFEKRESSVGSPTERFAQHEYRFVPIQGGGYDGNVGFLVKHNAQRGWYLRSIDVPSMRALHADRETLWGETPEDVVNKAIQMWTLAVAVPFEDPEATKKAEQERREKAKRDLEIQLRAGVRMRPGDR